MTNKTKRVIGPLFTLVPLAGCILFSILYIAATIYYPGGSQTDRNFKGFSWTQNYWCNLLNETAINGQHNSARPIALSAMVVLSFTLMIFWYIFPRQTNLTKNRRITIQVSGFIAMIIALFLFTKLHDSVINVASVFALIALAGTFEGLWKLNWKKLFWMGIFTIALVALNNFFYYNKNLLFYLPVVQKITFLYFLIWICLISLSMYNKNSEKIYVLTR